MAKLINIAADADALRLDRHHYQAFIGILTGQEGVAGRRDRGVNFKWQTH